MNKLICSCLIPSRKRISKLFTAIHTLNESASNLDDFEILIRLDDDDADSLQFLRTLRQFKNVKVFVGPRHQGYASLETIFYTELAAHSVGEWNWFLLDDQLIGGKDWNTKLRDVPTTGFIVQPEISRLGGSIYPKWEGSNFPIVPRNCWQQFGWTTICKPADTALDNLLRIQNGWKTWFLPGITAWHLEDSDENLSLHRKL